MILTNEHRYIVQTENNLRFFSGLSASYIYDDNNKTQLIIDWFYKGIYFKYKNLPWIMLSIDSDLDNLEIYRINTYDIKNTFKKLCLYAIEELNKLTKKYEIINKINEVLSKSEKIKVNY